MSTPADHPISFRLFKSAVALLSVSLLWPAYGFAVEQAGCSRSSSAGQLSAGSERDYTLAVVPFLPAERLELTFGPMAARFGELLDRDIHFRSATGVPRFAESLRAEEYDIAFLSSVLWVELELDAYQPLARIPGTFRGEFVTLESSPLESLEDLRGRELAVIRSEGVAHMAKFTLLEHGLDPTTDVSIRVLENALSCPQLLLAGTADACAATYITRERFAAQMDVELKVIGRTVAAPNALVVVHRRVPVAEREVIRETMMTWRDDPASDTGVPGVSLPSFVPFTSDDYDPIVDILRAARDR